MDACLSLEISIRKTPLNRNSYRFNSRFFTERLINHLLFPSFFFEKTTIHAKEHFCPIHSLNSSLSRMDRNKCRTFIVRIGKIRERLKLRKQLFRFFGLPLINKHTKRFYLFKLFLKNA